MKSKYKKIAIVAVIAGVLIFAGIATGIIPMWMFGGGGVGVVHRGPVYFYAEAKATDDTTDIDGAGTLEFWTGTAPYSLIEPALTMGTDTHTTLEYSSDMACWVVIKSTTANAMDHFSYYVEFPRGSATSASKSGALYTLEWSAADENWILTLKGGQEAAPDVVAYNANNVEVGTAHQDMSDNNYQMTWNLAITTQANYDGLFAFFDPDEADGEWDDLYLVVTCNVSAANAGYEILGPWQKCSDGKSYFINMREAGLLGPGGMTVRWDEQQQSGTIYQTLTLVSSDVDTSGAGHALFTITLQECNDFERAYYQTWESDTLTNFAGAVTTETIQVQD